MTLSQLGNEVIFLHKTGVGDRHPFGGGLPSRIELLVEFGSCQHLLWSRLVSLQGFCGALHGDKQTSVLLVLHVVSRFLPGPHTWCPGTARALPSSL